MSSKYKFNNPDAMYFTSTATVHWIDVFTRPLYRDIVIESLKYRIDKKGLIVYGYVIMTNHLHIIIGRKEEGMGLSDIVRDFKKICDYECG